MELTSHNIPFITKRALVKGEEYTRVLVGPYKNRNDAQRASEMIGQHTSLKATPMRSP